MGDLPPSEPSNETYAAIGHLCVAWSYVEMQSERVLWGILGLNADLAEAFVWRMGLLQRWQMIVREARKKFAEEEVNELKAMKKLIDTSQRDRNIVVHGVVHAMARLPEKPKSGAFIGTIDSPPPFERVPCWTIYMGDDAGKNFPVSTNAVKTIIGNVEKIQKLLDAYIARKDFTSGTPLADAIEENWPECF